MSIQVTQLEKSEGFGNVAITTDRRQSKFHFPPSHMLNLLNESFTDSTYEHPASMEATSGRFLVGEYDPNPSYSYGKVTYKPKVFFREVDDDGNDLEPELLVVMLGVEGSVPCRNFERDSLDPEGDSQWSYYLLGATWTPGHEVASRIVEHDRVTKFGNAIVDKIHATQIDGRDLSDYVAIKLIGE